MTQLPCPRHRCMRGSTCCAGLWHFLCRVCDISDTFKPFARPPGRTAVAAADVSAQQAAAAGLHCLEVSAAVAAAAIDCSRCPVRAAVLRCSTAAWGLVAACCVFISSPASFYALRFALGVAEAGAFPGCWYVCGQVRVSMEIDGCACGSQPASAQSLSTAVNTPRRDSVFARCQLTHAPHQFYPARWITVPYAVMEASIAVSQILAAPAAAVLLQLAGVGGLAGWQWLFLAGARWHVVGCTASICLHCSWHC